ncbi:MAG: glutamate--tRNA ligase [Candidatus Gastranaerophilales bacterium]|nr:glutamate--tRNA ligase [Candidatus Gastranaerophilales bacterium]
MTEKVRVRIAPSPSGNLHIGTARTALFNYLFAKKMNGEYVLRIEDTDLDRSSEDFKQNIFDSLHALGLDWDEGPDVGGPYGPYKQSERFDIYPKFAQMLIDKGYAYECFCSNEDLDKEHEIAKEKKIPYKYSRKCLNLTPEERAELKAKGIKPSIRFKVDYKELVFNDLVKGELKFDTSLIGDFAIMKSNGTPTYNFAVVIDDMLMKISHVIRGEDHISNTPKQILIYEALDAQVPKFGHLGMILAPDRSKLSKRHGATAVSDFIKQGYLTEALLNFVALLGWAPSDGVEIKNVNEIAADFRIGEISSSNSIFEYEKLNWMNGQYIKKMDISRLTDLALPFLNMYDTSKFSRSQLERIIEVTREPITVLTDLVHDTQYFFEKPVYDEVKELLEGEIAKNVLPYFKNEVENYDFNNEQEIHDKLADLRTYFKEQFGYKPKETMWAIRAALTGRTRGADMLAIIVLLGKDEVLKRLSNFM